VNASHFGKLFTVPVDGKVDAEPLYVTDLKMPNHGTHNVVVAATEHDTVYVFDANNGTVYWHVSLLKPGEMPSDRRNCSQVIPEIGITATPVIDRHIGPNGTIYLVAMSKDGNGHYYQRLHALDLATGAETLRGPVDIHAQFPGTGDNTNGHDVVFAPEQHEDRAALLLSKGIVYTSWSSHCDIRPYTGWTIGYDQSTLKQTGVFDYAPNGSEAAIWASGGGTAADAQGNLYFSVGNGTFDTTLNAQGFPAKADYGNAFVRLTPEPGHPPSQALPVTDYWTMYNTVAESDKDVDLGSGGLLLFDAKDAQGKLLHLGTGTGKDHNVYVFNQDAMGKFNPKNNSNIYQELPGALHGREFASPAIYGDTVYYGAVDDQVRAFKISDGKLQPQPTSVTKAVFPYPGTTPVVSADGSKDGIVWAYDNGASGHGANHSHVPAVLHAYNASNLAQELYNSNQAPNGRDQFGVGNKFIVPTVIDGHVYVGTTDSVVAFGLLSHAAAK
jgi:outer membrane protein assembly factor BamB